MASVRRPQAAERQRGVALLIVLLILATIAAVGVATTALVTRSVARAQAAQTRDAAVWALRGAETAALHLLEAGDGFGRSGAEDEDGTERSGGSRPGASAIGRVLTLPVGGASVTVRLDPVACVNVNAFVTGNAEAYATPPPPGGPGAALFGDLAVALGGNEPAALRLAEAAADFIDTDDAPNPGGAEDFDLTRRPLPYRTAGRLLADVSELRAVPGWDSATYSALKPYLCAVPSTAPLPIDVNSLRPGDAPILSAALGGTLPITEVERLIANRPAGGWPDAASFASVPIVAGVSPNGPPPVVDVTPSLLKLSGRVRVQGQTGQEFGMTALIFDEGGRWRVISRRFGPVAASAFRAPDEDA